MTVTGSWRAETLSGIDQIWVASDHAMVRGAERSPPARNVVSGCDTGQGVSGCDQVTRGDMTGCSRFLSTWRLGAWRCPGRRRGSRGITSHWARGADGADLNQVCSVAEPGAHSRVGQRSGRSRGLVEGVDHGRRLHDVVEFAPTAREGSLDGRVVGERPAAD